MSDSISRRNALLLGGGTLTLGAAGANGVLSPNLL